jgi:hypothetical protein
VSWLGVKKIGQWLSEHRAQLRSLAKVALTVYVVGTVVIVLLAMRGRPAAGAFTRVGGATHVETAVEASHFWLQPPGYVVTTPADASLKIMFEAARCAMVHDAPLLFTSADPNRQRLVNATLDGWLQEATATRLRRPVVASVSNQHDVTGCMAGGHPAYGDRLSTLNGDGLSILEAPKPLLEIPKLPVGDKLAPFVVFAAAIGSETPPDVAVGLALAAHMAKDRKVSLVVVPRYLEADPQLGDQLRGQSETVTGGIVLGQTPTVPDDTRALLRQLLAAPDLLAQIAASLLGIGGLIFGLFGLVGAAAAVAPEIPEIVKLVRRREDQREDQAGKETRQPIGTVSPVAGDVGSGSGGPTKATPPESAAVGDGHERVTVWLRSGWAVNGIRDDRGRWRLKDRPVLRLKDAVMVAPDKAKLAQLERIGSPDRRAEWVLVPVGDIELIHADVIPKSPDPDLANLDPGSVTGAPGGAKPLREHSS